MPKDSMWDLFGFSNDSNDSYSQQAVDIYDDAVYAGRSAKKKGEGILKAGKNWFDTNLDYPLLPPYKDTDLARQEEAAFKVSPLLGYPTAALSRGAYGLGNMFFGSPINAATTLAGGATIPLARAAWKGPELATKYGPKVAEALPKIYQGMKNVSRGLEGVQATRMGAETLEDLKTGHYGKALFDAGLTALGAFGASNKPYKYVEDLKRADVERQIGEAADKELLAKGIDPNAKLPETRRPANMPPPDKAIDTTGIEPTPREIKPPKGANANDPFWSPTIESNAKFSPNTGGDVQLMINARGGKRGVDDASLTRLQGAVDRVRDELAKLPEDVRNTPKAKASAYAFELDERDLSLAQSLGIIDPDVGTAAREIRKGLPPVATTLPGRPVTKGIGGQIADDAVFDAETTRMNAQKGIPVPPEFGITDVTNRSAANEEQAQRVVQSLQDMGKGNQIANDAILPSGGTKSTMENIDIPRLTAAEQGAEKTRLQGVINSINNDVKDIPDPVKRNAELIRLYAERFGYDAEQGVDELRDAMKLGVIPEANYNRISDAVSQFHDQQRAATKATGADVAGGGLPTSEANAPLTGVRELSRKIEAGEPLNPEELAQARTLGLNPPELPYETPNVPIKPGVETAPSVQLDDLGPVKEGEMNPDAWEALPDNQQPAPLTPDEQNRLQGFATNAPWEAPVVDIPGAGRPVTQGVDPTRPVWDKNLSPEERAVADKMHDARVQAAENRQSGQGETDPDVIMRSTFTPEELQLANLPAPVTQGVNPNALPPSLAAPTTPSSLPVTQGANVPAPNATPNATTPWRPAFLSPQTGKGPVTPPVDLPAGSGGAGGIPPPGNRPVVPNGDLPPRGPFDEKAHTDWMNEILKDVGRDTNMSPSMAIDRANRQLGPDTVRSLRKAFMDPNTPMEMRRAIVERLRQEAGLVEKPKGGIRNSIRSLTMASGEELKRIGPKGEEIFQLVRRARTDGGRNFNRFINPVIDDLNRLKKEPKIFEQVVDYVEGNLKNPSSEVKEVGDKITAINNLIGDEMVAAGLIKKKRADYWTHRYEGIPDGKLKENLEKMGLSGDRIDAMLKKIRESRERKTSAEFQRNDLNVPGYRKDIDVFVDHVRNSSRRLAEVEHWGKGDVIDKNSPISKAIASAEDPIRARNLTERIIRGGREGEPWEQKLVQRHRTLATATQLGLAGISNMSGVLPATVKMRMQDVGQGLIKAFKRDDPDFKFMNNVNTFREFSGGFAESLGDNNLIYKVFGIEQGQNYLNRMSGAAAHSYTKMLFNELKKNPNNKGVRRELRDLTTVNPDELLKQPSLTQGQIERSMINMTDMVQSSMAGEQLPHGWNRNDILRVPQVFQRTAFQITKAMKDAIKEKPTRALKIAAVGLPLGELIGDTKEVIKTGAQVAFREAQESTGFAPENDKNIWEEFKDEYPKNIGLGDKVDPTDRFAFTRKWLGAIDPDFAKNEGIVRGIGNLEQVFAFGMPSEQMTNLAEHWDSPDDWKAAVSTGLGTNYATSSAADILTQAWKGAHGNYRDVGRWGLQQVPIIGRGMAREVETTAQQKRRKKTYPKSKYDPQ